MFSVRVRANFDTSKLDEMARNFHLELKRAVDRAIMKAERVSKQEFLTGRDFSKMRPPINPTDTLGTRTGRLRSSVRGVVEDGNVIKGILQAGPLVYAKIHEFGGDAGRGGKTHIRQRSYLRRALEKVLPSLRDEISKIFWRGRFGA